MLRLIAAVTMIALCGPALGQTPEPRIPLYARVYVVAICAAAEEITDDCLNQGLVHASYALSEMHLRAYRGQPLWNSLRVRFPYGFVENSQRRFLSDLERRAAGAAKEALDRDITQFALPDGLREQQLALIDEWSTLAQSNAANGGNWSHDWSENRHDFAPAQAVGLFSQINLRAAYRN